MLELIDVTKRYGEVEALRELSLRVEPGRVHGFVGRNGAGKTTAMRVALGLTPLDGGEIRWKGSAPTAEDRRSWGYMPEERGLYPKMTASAQVALFARLSGLGRGDAAAAAARMLARLELDDRADAQVGTLSLGNQQRVQLAVALVSSPDLLVLDEPFSGLDPVGVDVLVEVLEAEVARGAGVIFSSHQLELVERICDEVTVIDAGAVVAGGPIEAVRNRHGADRLRVALDGGWTAWAEHLEGWTVIDREGAAVVLQPTDGADDQLVLDAARSAGRVRSFGWERPTLTDLFREVVAK